MFRFKVKVQNTFDIKSKDQEKLKIIGNREMSQIFNNFHKEDTLLQMKLVCLQKFRSRHSIFTSMKDVQIDSILNRFRMGFSINN